MYIAPQKNLPRSDLGFSFRKMLRRVERVAVAPIVAPTRFAVRALHPLERPARRLVRAGFGKYNLLAQTNRLLLKPLGRKLLPHGSAPTDAPVPDAGYYPQPGAAAPYGYDAAPVYSEGSSSDNLLPPPGLMPGDISQAPGLLAPPTIAPISDTTNTPDLPEAEAPAVDYLPPDMTTPMVGPAAVMQVDAKDEGNDAAVPLPQSAAVAQTAKATAPKSIAQKWRDATPAQKVTTVAVGVGILKLLALI